MSYPLKITVGVLAIASAALISPSEKVKVADEIAGTRTQRLNCLDMRMGEIKARRNAEAVHEAFLKCKNSLIRTAPRRYMGLSEGLQYGAFLTLVSSAIAPYGNTHNLTRISDILSAPFTNCAPQSIFVAKALYAAYPNLLIRHVGIINKRINHALVYAEDRSGQVLLDPTTAVVVTSKLDDILEGQPLGSPNVINHYNFEDTKLSLFNISYRGALTFGGLRKADVVYDIRVTSNFYPE